MSTEQPTGQALNGLIAERVMGWTEWRGLTKDCPNLPGVTYFADWGDKGGVAVYEADDLHGEVAFYFNPVVEIADAWLVVKQMFRQPEEVYDVFLLELTKYCPQANDTPDKVMGWFLPISNKPEMICRAALAAVGAFENAQVAQASAESFVQHTLKTS